MAEAEPAGLLLIGWSLVTSLSMLYLVFAGIGLAQAIALYELLQVLIDQFGWRAGLAMLAAAQIGICMPIQLAVIQPRRDVAGRAHADDDAAGSGRAAVAWALRQPVFGGLFAAMVAYRGLFSAISFHIYRLLLERGFDPATVVGALPVVLLLLLWLPTSFAALAGFAGLYGAVNGFMTIIRGVAIPEMLTPRAYGTLNGIIAGPAIMLEALAPVGAAALTSTMGSYESVLIGAVGSALVAALAFCFAALRRPRSAAA